MTPFAQPSELAPLSCLLLAEMCTAAGLPAGALNVVTGLGADAGGPLSAHSDVDKVSFTGAHFFTKLNILEHYNEAKNTNLFNVFQFHLSLINDNYNPTLQALCLPRERSWRRQRRGLGLSVWSWAGRAP